MTAEEVVSKPPAVGKLVKKTMLTCIISQDSHQPIACAAIRVGGATAAEERRYALGTDTQFGVIPAIQEWADLRGKRLVGLWEDGIKKCQNVIWTLLKQALENGKGSLIGGVDFYHEMKTFWRCLCLQGTSSPTGGTVHADAMILHGYVASAVLNVDNEYSDAFAAAMVEPKAFQGILDSPTTIHKKLGTAMWLFGMKCLQCAIDNRDYELKHSARLFFATLGCQILTAFNLHPDTMQNLHALFLSSVLLLGREADACKTPHRASTRNQEIYHSAIRSKSHMHEVTYSQLLRVVQHYKIIHVNCERHGWDLQATHAHRLEKSKALPNVDPMDEKDIWTEVQKAAWLAKRILEIAGWKSTKLPEIVTIPLDPNSGNELRAFLRIASHYQQRCATGRNW